MKTDGLEQRRIDARLLSCAFVAVGAAYRAGQSLQPLGSDALEPQAITLIQAQA